MSNPINALLQQVLGFPPMQHAMIPQTFRRKYHAYSPAYWNSVNKDKLEKGDKIVLPASALDELSRMNIQFPIMFQIEHISDILPKISHCSVMEFTAPEGDVYLPLWMINNLGLDPSGDSVVGLTTVSLPKGEYVQFQAHETKFAMLEHPRVVLEVALRLYSCLTVGDTIQVEFNNHIYKLDVTDVNPKKRIEDAPYAVSIIETDIRVDFKEPRDYKDWEAKHKKNNNNNALKNDQNGLNKDNKDDEEEEDFIKPPNNNDNILSNNKASYFEQLTASGSQPLKLKDKTNKKKNNNEIDYSNNNIQRNVVSNTRGQSLGFNSNDNQNRRNSNGFNNVTNPNSKKNRRNYWKYAIYL